MATSREDDKPNQEVPPRTERLYCSGDLWYFKVREGESVGPFRYRSEAQSNLDQYLESLKEKSLPS